MRCTTPSELGAALRSARRSLKLTQADLAIAAGVGLRFIVELEAGKPTVRLEQTLRVVAALGGSLNIQGLPTPSEPSRPPRQRRRRSSAE